MDQNIARALDPEQRFCDPRAMEMSGAEKFVEMASMLEPFYTCKWGEPSVFDMIPAWMNFVALFFMGFALMRFSKVRAGKLPRAYMNAVPLLLSISLFLFSVWSPAHKLLTGSWLCHVFVHPYVFVGTTILSVLLIAALLPLWIQSRLRSEKQPPSERSA